MSLSPIAYNDSLRIGSVDYVSPSEIKVLLDIEAPDSMALNAGYPRPFPRVNSYILIPNENGYLVGQVEWITIEQSPYPKRKGMQDFGIIDLPYPLRKMSLNPLGCLLKSSSNYDDEFEFKRGVVAYPTVGDPVVLPTLRQLHSIVESGKNRRVKIGTSPLAGNADVYVDPNRLFGRHLAVLGNTGSGKSCSVAGLIRWSIEAAQHEIDRKARVQTDFPKNTRPNSRFIILDPNGEYSEAFSGLKNVNCFAVATNDTDHVKRLEVPIWFWNCEEWSAFTQASAKTQRPILRRALRDIRRGSKIDQNSNEEKRLNLRRYLSYQYIKIRSDITSNTIKNGANKFGFYLKSIFNDISKKKSLFPDFNKELETIISNITTALNNSHNSFYNKEGKIVEYYNAFDISNLQPVLSSLETLIDKLGGLVYQEKNMGEDTPLPFKVSDFADYVQMLGIEENSSQFIDFLVMRIRDLLTDKRIESISESNISLNDWLNKYICKSHSSDGSITVIDLSLVPAEVIHIITAVIARMILEALQRYRKNNNGETLPTTIVMEEAHTFIKRYSDSDEMSSATICTRIFEKIAREGRKFGLGLVISSQRPSELSSTVLSQCNTFLLHRISNDQDQELVRKLVPDNLQGILRELPTLPSRDAILLGWASELPILVRMNYLDEKFRPKSNDPDYWNVWTKTKQREVDWNTISSEWQNPIPD